MKKFIAVLLIAALLSGCSDKSAESGALTAQTETSPETVTSAETTTEPETTSASEKVLITVEMETEETSEYFTTFAPDRTSADCFTCEGEKGSWAHLVNPYNNVSLFNPISPGTMDSDIENIVICFNVSGVSEEMTAFCGILAYGLGEDDDELSVWDNNTYSALTGENFEFVISEDGYYEMTVPIRKLAEGLDSWEGLSYTSIVEVAFYGAEGVDESGEYTKQLKDGLSFEFLGIKAK